MNADPSSPDPLSDEELARTPLDMHRHEAPPREPVTATYDVITPRGSEPQVDLDQLSDGTWRLRVTVEEGEAGAVRPAGHEVVIVRREELLQLDGEDLTPSLPEDVRFTEAPDLREIEEFLIRFGDIRYRPTTIFDPDGRRAYYDERYPWVCLVRLTTPRGWSGSGVLIGPRHVLTASHCIDWTPGWAQVDVLWTDGSSLDSAGATHVYAETRVGPGSIDNSDTDEDYAVLVLDRRLGDRFGWMGTRRYDSGWDGRLLPWRNIGYPEDWSSVGDTAVYQRDFALDEDDLDLGSARLILSDTFDNWPGQSGSPIFGFWGDGPRVVGVVSGQTSDNNYISGGSLLNSLVNKARSDFP